MKKLLLACSLMGLVAAANAQPPTAPADGPPPHCKTHDGKHWDPAKRAERMQKTLQLSDEQTAKIKKIFEDGNAQRQALDEKYKPQLEAFRADMEKLRKQTRAEVESVLTAKQKEALKAQWQARENRHSHRGPVRGDRPSTE